MLLTVFTPTYNRAGTLERLYASLCRQTDKDFEWLVVDDGSTDNTRELVSGWQSENIISVRYTYQENAGKPMAHNLGAREARGELFICLDSDDYLTDSAVEVIKRGFLEMPDGCIGLLAYKLDTDGKAVTALSDKTVKTSTLKGAYDNHGLYGDTALVFKTQILRKHAFPGFRGEKFIPEGYLYDRLDGEGELYIVRCGIYVCEYLNDGYTANMKRLLYKNPQGYFTYIKQRLSVDKTLKHKFLDSVRYMAMAIAHKRSGKIKLAVYPFLAFLAYFPGWLLYVRDFKRYRNGA